MMRILLFIPVLTLLAVTADATERRLFLNMPSLNEDSKPAAIPSPTAEETDLPPIMLKRPEPAAKAAPKPEPKAAPKPVAKPKPAPKPVEKPAPVVKKEAPKPEPKPVAKPKPAPAPEPVVEKPVEEPKLPEVELPKAETPKPEPKPVAKPEPVKQPALPEVELPKAEAPKEAPKPVEKPAPVVKKEAPKVEEPVAPAKPVEPAEPAEKAVPTPATSKEEAATPSAKRPMDALEQPNPLSTAREVPYDLAYIDFASNSVMLPAFYREQLEAVAKQLKETKPLQIEVRSYALFRQGVDGRKQALARAVSVRNFLVAAGLPTDSVATYVNAIAAEDEKENTQRVNVLRTR